MSHCKHKTLTYVTLGDVEPLKVSFLEHFEYFIYEANRFNIPLKNNILDKNKIKLIYV